MDEEDGLLASALRRLEMGEDFGGEDIDQLAEEAAQEAAGGGDPGSMGDSSSDDL